MIRMLTISRGTRPPSVSLSLLPGLSLAQNAPPTTLLRLAHRFRMCGREGRYGDREANDIEKLTWLNYTVDDLKRHAVPTKNVETDEQLAEAIADRPFSPEKMREKVRRCQSS